jgi:hypothetical protein
MHGRAVLIPIVALFSTGFRYSFFRDSGRQAYTLFSLTTLPTVTSASADKGRYMAMLSG